MKILLVEPPKSPRSIGGEDHHVFEPLSLEYVGASVLPHHDVELLDMRLDPDLESAIGRFRPDLIGVTGMTVHVNVIKDMLANVKAKHPKIITVVGGHHATVAPTDFYCEQVDFVVSGEAVFTFPELVRRLEAKRDPSDALDIPGVSYVRGARWTRTPHELRVDLDAFPLPARSLTRKYRGRYFSQWMHSLASMVTSKGCPSRCNYCVIWRQTGGRLLTRSPERMLEELKAIEEKWVFFADYESLCDAKRMTELARLIREAGIEKRYVMYARSDTVIQFPELIREWTEIGLDVLIVGFEFFRDEDLRAVNKSASVDDNEATIRILQDLGVTIGAYFMVRPDFDRSDFQELRAYLRRMKLPFASVFVLTPLPGTPLYEEKKHELRAAAPELFDFYHAILPTKLPLSEFYEEVYQTWRAPASTAGMATLLRKFRLRDLPMFGIRARDMLKRLRHAGDDHGPSTPLASLADDLVELSPFRPHVRTRKLRVLGQS